MLFQEIQENVIIRKLIYGNDIPRVSVTIKKNDVCIEFCVSCSLLTLNAKLECLEEDKVWHVNIKFRRIFFVVFFSKKIAKAVGVECKKT